MSSKHQHTVLCDGQQPAEIDRKAASIAMRRISAVIKARRESMEECGTSDCSWAKALTDACSAATYAASEHCSERSEHVPNVPNAPNTGLHWFALVALVFIGLHWFPILATIGIGFRY